MGHPQPPEFGAECGAVATIVKSLICKFDNCIEITLGNLVRRFQQCQDDPCTTTHTP